MISIKEASEIAIEHLTTLYSEQDLGQVLLEEAELTDDNTFWFITLSFKRPNAAGRVGESVFAANRNYKVLKIDSSTGEVRSIRNQSTQ